jgi:hypothetical protein
MVASFPSGHTASAMTLATVLGVLLHDPARGTAARRLFGFLNSTSDSARPGEQVRGSPAAISTILVRLDAPDTRVTALRRTPNASATAASAASVALPSTARALTRTTRAPACSLPTPGCAEPGRTRIVIRMYPVCSDSLSAAPWPDSCQQRPTPAAANRHSAHPGSLSRPAGVSAAGIAPAGLAFYPCRCVSVPRALITAFMEYRPAGAMMRLSP